ncbi:MAG: hypothetical protein GX797_07820 [Chloroflexi bacterium]|jgi:hypothetical protein|nr:hypothetical protein [Chloroflexota bacterium]
MKNGPFKRFGPIEYFLIIILILMVLFTLFTIFWPAIELFYQNTIQQSYALRSF